MFTLYVEPKALRPLTVANVFSLEIEITIREGHPEYNSY